MFPVVEGMLGGSLAHLAGVVRPPGSRWKEHKKIDLERAVASGSVLCGHLAHSAGVVWPPGSLEVLELEGEEG